MDMEGFLLSRIFLNNVDRIFQRELIGRTKPFINLHGLQCVTILRLDWKIIFVINLFVGNKFRLSSRKLENLF